MKYILNNILVERDYLLYNLFTAFVIAVFLAVEEIFDDNEEMVEVFLELLTDIPVFFIICMFITLLAHQVIRKLDGVMPWGQAMYKRYIIEIVIIFFLVILLTCISSYIVYILGFSDEDSGDEDFGFEILASIMYFISLFMLFSFQEFTNINRDKNLLSYRAIELQKQNYITRYEALKNQINPHFMFNSLNVLSSLIYKDPVLSDKFIRKFSEVFRYVLELNQEQLVPLKQELKFIDSYVFLQKIRYGDSLIIHQKIDSDSLSKFVLPMSLQIILENAIVHNIVSKEEPLVIEIICEFDIMYIKNKYQIRENKLKSTGIGQQNLKERYKILNQNEPKFYIEEDWYIAKLPLIEKNDVKSFDY